MRYQYETEGTCSRLISFDLEDGVVSNVEFKGGCNGNLKAISRLIDGKDAKEVSSLLSGITCGRRPTSCGDQLSKALSLAMEAQTNG